MKQIVVAQPLGLDEDKIASFKNSFLKEEYEVTYYTTLPKNQEELAQRLAPAHIAVVANYPVTKEALEKAPYLSYLCIAFTGVDHVDIETCKKRNISVSNCAGYSTTSVAELAVGLTLSLYRKIAEGNQKVRKGGTNQSLIGLEIAGKTVGIIGTGAIGRETAKRFEAFGATVYGYSRTQNDPSISYLSLKELLSLCDIISIHVPATKDTYYLLNEENMRLMKKNAILINTARGSVVDNAALAKLLTDGKIAGAGIDVFDVEPPLPKDTPLLHAPNTVLLPHVGFDTKEAMERRAEIVIDNIHFYEAGIVKNRIV